VLKEAYAQSAGAQKKKLEMLSMHPEQLDN
jgi:hypothetical protein